MPATATQTAASGQAPRRPADGAAPLLSLGQAIAAAAPALIGCSLRLAAAPELRRAAGCDRGEARRSWTRREVGVLRGASPTVGEAPGRPGLAEQLGRPDSPEAAWVVEGALRQAVADWCAALDARWQGLLDGILFEAVIPTSSPPAPPCAGENPLAPTLRRAFTGLLVASHVAHRPGYVCWTQDVTLADLQWAGGPCPALEPSHLDWRFDDDASPRGTGFDTADPRLMALPQALCRDLLTHDAALLFGLTRLDLRLRVNLPLTAHERIEACLLEATPT